MQIRSADRGGFTLVELLVVIAVIGVLIALLLPAVQAARSSVGRMSCGSNLKQIALGLHQYHDTFKRLPPNGYLRSAATGRETDASWLLAILPYVEQTNLYDSWWFDDRYDKDPRQVGFTPSTAPRPSNFWIAAQPIPVYSCPSDGTNGDGVLSTQFGYGQYGHPVGVTSYKGVMGSNWNIAPFSVVGSPFAYPGPTPWPESNGVFSIGVQSLKGTRISSISDGLSSTLMVGEALPAHQYYNSWAAFFYGQTATCAVPINAPATCSKATSSNWDAERLVCRQTFPDTFTLGMSFASRHHGGAQFSLADGSVRMLYDEIDLGTYRQLGTRALGEVASVP